MKSLGIALAAVVVLSAGTPCSSRAESKAVTRGAAFQPVKAKHGYFRTSDGVRLHYIELGKGPAIVFVPGWTVPAWMWDPQIRHFSKEYRVIALDPRSQGRSDRATEGHYPERRSRDIKELVDKLALAPVILVGHSLAVMELLCYLDQFGTSTLAGVVLVDGELGPFPKPEGAAEFLGFLRANSLDRRLFLGQMTAHFYKKPIPPGYMELVIEDALRTPTSAALALLVGGAGMDYRPALTKANVPILYTIAPETRENGEWLKKTVPSASVEVFEDCGHVLFIEDPERFNAVVERFARGAFEKRHTPVN